MEEQLQNEENEKAVNLDGPELCGGKAMPANPPYPGATGYWSCELGSWVWVSV